MRLKQLLIAQRQLLLFRCQSFEVPDPGWPSFLFVLVITWLTGIGRYWDHPDASLFQHSGLGSVIYLLVMSTILYLVIAPAAPLRITWPMLFLFVGMTSLPGLLYAIPVEQFLSTETAAAMNLRFLLIVAVWRVLLLLYFCRMAAGLSRFGSLVTAILPLSTIMVLLAAFSLEHVTFDLMAGLNVNENAERTTAGLAASAATEAVGWSHSAVYGLSLISWFLFPTCFLVWLVLVIRKIRKKRRAAKAAKVKEGTSGGTTGS